MVLSSPLLRNYIMEFQDIKSGVGDLSDLFIEKPTKVADEQEGRFLINKEATIVTYADEGYCPTRISYTPYAWGSYNIPLYFNVAVDGDIVPKKNHKHSIYGNFIKEHNPTNDALYGSGNWNVFADQWWSISTSNADVIADSKYNLDGSLVSATYDRYPDPTMKNMGNHWWRTIHETGTSKQFPHIRGICIQPSEGYDTCFFDLKTDFTVPLTPIVNIDGGRFTVSVMARWEGLHDHEGVIMRLTGEKIASDGTVLDYMIPKDKYSDKLFVGFGQRIGNVSYSVVDNNDGTKSGKWNTGSLPNSNWQQYIFTLDPDNLYFDDPNPTVEGTWHIRLHFTSINYYNSTQYLLSGVVDPDEALLRTHGKIWLAEFKLFVNTNETINRVYETQFLTLGTQSSQYSIKGIDEPGWNDLRLYFNADDTSCYNPINIDDLTEQLINRATVSYEVINMQHSTVETIDILPEDMVNCVSGLDTIVIDPTNKDSDGKVEFSFWLKNVDIGKNAYNSNRVTYFHIAKNAITGSLFGTAIKSIKAEIYDVGVGTNTSGLIITDLAPCKLGTIQPIESIDKSISDKNTWFSIIKNENDPNRYYHIKIIGTADFSESTYDDYNYDTDISNVASGISDIKIAHLPLKDDIPGLWELTHTLGFIRFYPYNITRKTSIFGANVDYHPLTLQSYIDEGELFIEPSNTLIDGVDELTFTGDNGSYTVHAFNRTGYNSLQYLRDKTFNAHLKTVAYGNMESIADAQNAVLNSPNTNALGGYGEYVNPIHYILPMPSEIYPYLASGELTIIPVITNSGSTTVVTDANGWDVLSGNVYPSYIHPLDNRYDKWKMWTMPYLTRALPTANNDYRPRYYGVDNNKNWYGMVVQGAIEINANSVNVYNLNDSGEDKDDPTIPDASMRVPICEGPCPDNNYSIVIRSDAITDDTKTWVSTKWDVGHFNVCGIDYDTYMRTWSSTPKGNIENYFRLYDIDEDNISEYIIPSYKTWISDTMIKDFSIDTSKIFQTEFDNDSTIFDQPTYDTDGKKIIYDSGDSINQLSDNRFTVKSDNDLVVAWIDIDSSSNEYAVFSRVNILGNLLWEPRIHSGWFYIDQGEGFYYAMEYDVSLSDNSDTEITMSGPSPRHQAPIFIDVAPILTPTEMYPYSINMQTEQNLSIDNKAVLAVLVGDIAEIPSGSLPVPAGDAHL